MNFTMNFQMKKPTLCCCFAWIIFTELNFTVAFLVMRKTWEDRFASMMGGWGVLQNRRGS